MAASYQFRYGGSSKPPYCLNQVIGTVQLDAGPDQSLFGITGLVFESATLHAYLRSKALKSRVSLVSERVDRSFNALHPFD